MGGELLPAPPLQNPVLLIDKFPSFALLRNAIMLQRLIIQFPLYYPSNGRLREVKNKRKFQTIRRFLFSNRRFQIIVIVLGSVWYFGKVVAEERWSLTRGGCNRRIDCNNYAISIFGRILPSFACIPTFQFPRFDLHVFTPFHTNVLHNNFHSC